MKGVIMAVKKVVKNVRGMVYYDCPDLSCPLPAYFERAPSLSHSIPLALAGDDESILCKIIGAIADEVVRLANHYEVSRLTEINEVRFCKFMNCGGDWGVVTGKFGYESNSKHFYGCCLSGYAKDYGRSDVLPHTVTIPIPNDVIERAINVAFKL
jgi:hypothetical protein